MFLNSDSKTTLSGKKLPHRFCESLTTSVATLRQNSPFLCKNSGQTMKHILLALLTFSALQTLSAQTGKAPAPAAEANDPAAK